MNKCNNYTHINNECLYISNKSMIKILRYLANKIEAFKLFCAIKWNRFLEKIKL